MAVNFGFPHLVILNADLERWKKSYGLEPFKTPCSKCNKELIVNLPFVAKDRRGLRADTCECGNEEVPFEFIDFNYRELGLWIPEEYDKPRITKRRYKKRKHLKKQERGLSVGLGINFCYSPNSIFVSILVKMVLEKLPFAVTLTPTLFLV